MTDLGGSQISTLLETLPGIATVLRSPVADALVNVIRAAARLAEFDPADAEELVHYSVRRSLLAGEEGERLLEDVQAAAQRRADRAAERRTRSGQARPHAGARTKPATRSRPKAASKSKAQARPRPKVKARTKAKAKAKPKSQAAARRKAPPRSKRR